MNRRPTQQFFSYALILTMVGSLFSIVLPASLPSYASHENITVNVSGDEIDDVYDSGDDIAVEGVIDDLVDNEDVTIRFKDPSGSIEHTENFGEPSSNGYFDAVFEVPSNADEGVWTIEVDYDNKQAYTYAIVDDDTDTIDVNLDQTDRIYEAGDDVVITGQVDDDDISAEPEVQITILDPLDASEPILDEEDVELGAGSLNNDEFRYVFELDNDASHGRYAVIVTYDVDNQAGSTLFEILDEDAGAPEEEEEIETVTSGDDGDLSAEIDEDTYDVGATVTISGTIEDYDQDEELSISINDPDDLEIFEEDDASVDEDGSDANFELDYELRDNADEGAYTVIVGYNNLEVELVFEVKKGSSGSGTEDVTLKLNKASYLAGESITVTGTVAKLQEDDEGEPEVVSILLYRPTGLVILQASKYVEPTSSRAYSATILLDSKLEVAKSYKIIAAYAGDSAEIRFDITGVSTAPSDKITVDTDKSAYSMGSTVEISGKVPAALIVSGQQLLIRVNTPDGNPCRIDPISVPASGSYSYDLVLGGQCGLGGEYDIEVTYGGKESKTSFTVGGSSGSAYNLNVGGNAHPIKYELSSGSIKGMFVRPTEDKLVITLDGQNEGQLKVELPRDVIDAIENGEDIDYVVTIEDESGNVVEIDVEESENNDNARTLVIDYPAGADRIEIAGTSVIPEFGQVAAIVLAISVAGIIVFAKRYQDGFKGFLMRP